MNVVFWLCLTVTALLYEVQTAAAFNVDDSFFIPAAARYRMRGHDAADVRPSQFSRLYRAGNNRHMRQEESLEDSEALLDAIAAIRSADEEPYLFDAQLDGLEAGDEAADAYELLSEESAHSGAAASRDETASHGSLAGAGSHQFQYVSGGTGEGKQLTGPDSDLENKEEVKSDEDLPAYCDPPNPCPVGYTGDDCDNTRTYEEYTAEYSKHYQEQQNCMCDDDHNECSKARRAKSSDTLSNKKYSAPVAKKSPRMKRDVAGANRHQEKTGHVSTHQQLHHNRLFGGKALKMHVAKKSI